MRGVLADLGSLRYAAVCLAAVLAVASIPGKGAAQRADDSTDPDQRRYRQVIEDAVDEFRLGHWEEAVVLFREAHALRPSAKTHRGLGLALFEARDYVRAIPHLEGALGAQGGTFSADERERLEHTLEQALRFVGRITVVVEPSDAIVSVDGSSVDPSGALLLNPGKHLIAVDAEGYVPVQQALDVEGSDTRTLRIALVRANARGDEAPSGEGDAAAPPSAPAPSDLAEAPAPEAGERPGSDVPAVLGWVSAGLAVAGLATGVVLWRMHDDGPAADWKRNDCVGIPTLDATCHGIQSRADGLEAGSIAATVAGGVFAVTSVVMFVIAGGGSDEEPAAAQVRCGAGIGALTCAGRF